MTELAGNGRTPRMYELEYPAPDVASEGSHGPTLIVALQGYADAGQAVESSSEHLLQALDHRLLATFNTDELIDYRSRRPAVTIEHNELIDAELPELNLHVVRDSAGTSFLLLSGPEPDLRWESFTRSVADLAERFGVQQTICLYGAPMAVPHTRPLVVSAHGNSKELVSKLFSINSRIIIPGSASLHIERKLHKRGRNVAGFTAHVPHYLAASDYPEATYRLLGAISDTTGLKFPLAALEADAEKVRIQIEEQVQDSHEIQAVVRALESQYDSEMEQHQRNEILPGDSEIPTGDELGAEFERFLAGLDAEDDDTESGDS
ncbi:PAC2 family protein [Corynebacterium kalinowskii]|uniref:PAC2 family protein n=1 Tax=Corynebacterium kalinowskii TaxID=2675216 RepID=A0A6B8W444_9CORY|nr:PAC2 family protein [Corynebacterium kalinowskii]QGU02198.1 PAC2 family protein [Corynebacterium kalinowskii]